MFDSKAQRKSVRKFNRVSGSNVTIPINGISGSNKFFGRNSGLDSLKSIKNTIPDYSPDTWQLRDSALREFALSAKEPYLTSFIEQTTNTRAGLKCTFDGTPGQVTRIKKVFDMCDYGEGWHKMIKKVLTDLFTTDNGGFIEVIRVDNKDCNSPVICMNHLDSNYCVRTGNPAFPIYYCQPGESPRKMAFHRIMMFNQMPHPESRHKGRGVCFVSRVLQGVRFTHSTSERMLERSDGRYSSKIHFITNVPGREIDQIKNRTSMQADNAGHTYYQEHHMVAGVDPKAGVDVASIDLAEMPTNFDRQAEFDKYILLLAMSASTDTLEAGTLVGNNGLGSSSISETVAAKGSRGSKNWTTELEEQFRIKQILPRGTTCNFEKQDLSTEREICELKAKGMNYIAEGVNKGILRQDQAITLALKEKIIDNDIFQMTPSKKGRNSNTPRNITVSSNTDSDGQIKSYNRNREFVNYSVRKSLALHITNLYILHENESRIKTLPIKVETFAHTLVKIFKYCGVIGDEYLQYACSESGIPYQELLTRLPNNYFVKLYNEGWEDSLTTYFPYKNNIKEKSYNPKYFSYTKGFTSYKTKNCLELSGLTSMVRQALSNDNIVDKQSLLLSLSYLIFMKKNNKGYEESSDYNEQIKELYSSIIHIDNGELFIKNKIINHLIK